MCRGGPSALLSVWELQWDRGPGWIWGGAGTVPGVSQDICGWCQVWLERVAGVTTRCVALYHFTRLCPWGDWDAGLDSTWPVCDPKGQAAKLWEQPPL